jgi:hypothetical protein
MDSVSSVNKKTKLILLVAVALVLGGPVALYVVAVSSWYERPTRIHAADLASVQGNPGFWRIAERVVRRSSLPANATDISAVCDNQRDATWFLIFTTDQAGLHAFVRRVTRFGIDDLESAPLGDIRPGSGFPVDPKGLPGWRYYSKGMWALAIDLVRNRVYICAWEK